MHDILLLYYSGTGNTELVTLELKRRLKDEGFGVELIDAERLNENFPLNLENKILGFGFPIYGHDYPYQMWNPVLERMSANHSPVPAFIYSTSWNTPGIGANHFGSLLKKKHIDIIAKKNFLCPSNGWFCLVEPESPKAKSMHFDPFLFTRIRQFAVQIKKAIHRYRNRPFCINTLTNPLGRVMVGLSKNLEAKLWNNYSINQTQCVNCQRCLKSCPDRNFQLRNGRVEFINNQRCLWCMRYICNCPQNAISLGKATDGKGRYTPKFRDELIRKQVRDLPENGE